MIHPKNFVQENLEASMADSIQETLSRLRANMESVVFGKSEVVKFTLVALLAGEHILLEDVPGVGKTLIGKALAKSVDGQFTRIQFTPDLLPSDIVGSGVYHAAEGNFQFHPGPVFANVVLGDEINRAPPRTQSALLEAMSERQVSVDGTTHVLPEPFWSSRLKTRSNSKGPICFQRVNSIVFAAHPSRISIARSRATSDLLARSR